MKKKLIFIVIWFLFAYTLKHLNFLPLDFNTVKDFFIVNKNYAFLLIIALWIVRLLFFIPGTTLMILSGICFGPIESLLLSTVGQILSGTLVYLFSRSFTDNKVKRFLDNQYPAFNDLLVTYNYKFLALGMICPIAPTDIICFLSASVGIKYSTYILTIIIANIPLRMLYSFVGISLLESKLGMALVIITFVLVATISIKVWTTLKQKPEQKNCRNSC
ncbi:TVP38/TMEM64 family protein [Viridibacillus arvi]|uniref:TVP38/TMEM64 family protein n=1 Tax=Viridibacillus arvi TaxID=263475 RepID=UPI0036ED99F2